MSQIEFRSIQNVIVRSKITDERLVTTISFVTDMSLAGLWKLLELAAAGVRIDVVFSSPQAAFELDTA